jgi:gamma-glutamylcyclotransferase (GGCT)/AIG2-like uncharacterized protein YtfP
LLVDGASVRCAELGQRTARALTGVPADSDGLAAEEVGGQPHPDEWPDALFGYGLLQPGRRGWPLLAPHVLGLPRRACARGTRYDTGLGWPAMLLGDQPGVPGTLTRLREPAALLPALDRYEGPDYRRVRIVVALAADHRAEAAFEVVSWAYVWVGDRSGLRPDAPEARGWPRPPHPVD